ncbi:MAG: conjugal transfer protein TraN, partial [Gallionella sp.]|nr:conjugal transfer protein TraN [Gallionella sp.]
MAADCKKTGSICVDSTPCKMVGGNQVCLSQLGLSCWNYEDTYTCLKPDAVDYCAAIKQVPECHQTGSVCATSDTLLGTGCMKWTNTWQCGASVAAPAGTVKLDTTHTIASDTIDSAACNSLASNPTCTLAAHTCTEPGGTRIINGLAVAKDCWAWRDDYSCMGP